MAALLIFALLLQTPDPMALAREAYELARGGKLAEAEGKLREAIKGAPGNALLYSALGGLLGKMDRAAEARQAFAEAVKLAPENHAVRLQLAVRQREAGELEPAWENARRLLEAKAADAQVSEFARDTALELGALLARQNRNRAGLAVARQAAGQFPDSGPVQEMLGLFQRNNQQNVDAMTSYRRALELNPESAGAAVGLGIAASAAGSPEEAARAFQGALAKFPDYVPGKLAYAVFLLRQAEAGAAGKVQPLELLEEVLKLDPNSAEAHYQLGSALLAQDRAQDALGHLKRAVEAGLDDKRVHFALARAYRRLGDAAAAQRETELFKQREAGR